MTNDKLAAWPASGGATISARQRVFFAPDLSAPDLSRAWTLHRRDFALPLQLICHLSSVICHARALGEGQGPGLHAVEIFARMPFLLFYVRNHRLHRTSRSHTDFNGWAKTP